MTVRGSTWTETVPAGRHHSDRSMSYFMTGGPGKEHRTNKPPLTRRVWEKSKGYTMCLTTSQNPFHWPPSWLTNVCTTRKDSESEG